MLLSFCKSDQENTRTLDFGALVQMATLGLVLIGIAVVLFGSLFNPRQSDPMGIFGLPTVCAIACRPTKVRNRATGPISIAPQRMESEAA